MRKIDVSGHIRQSWLIILVIASLCILIVLPAIDAFVISKLNILSPSYPDIPASSILNANTSNDEAVSVQDEVSQKETNLSSYERILQITTDISIPIISVVVPIVAIAVPLFDIVKKEKNERLEIINSVVRQMFRVGTEIYFSHEWYQPLFIADGESGNPHTVSFELSLPEKIAFPGIGLNVLDVQAEFFELCTTKKGVLLYEKKEEEDHFSPELKFSLSISNDVQQDIAKRLFSSQAFSMGCYMKIHMELDSWQGTYYDVSVAFQVKKHSEGSNENKEVDKVFCLINQLSSIELLEHRKEIKKCKQ